MAEAPLFNYDPNMVQGLNGINPFLYMMFPEYSSPPPISGDLMSLRSGQLGRDMDMQLLNLRQNAALSKAAKAQADADWQAQFAQASAGANTGTVEPPAEPEYEPLPSTGVGENPLGDLFGSLHQLAMSMGRPMTSAQESYGGPMRDVGKGRVPPSDLGSLGGKILNRPTPYGGRYVNPPDMPVMTGPTPTPKSRKTGTLNIFDMNGGR